MKHVPIFYIFFACDICSVIVEKEMNINMSGTSFKRIEKH